VDLVGAGPNPLIRFAWLVEAVLLAGCTTAGTPTPAPPTAAPSPSAAPTAAPPTAAPTAQDPLAFFRAQEETCKQHAAQLGITAVEAERFRDAKVVRDVGDGATEIEDGRGTRLVVVPRRGVVLPASGRPTDVMPPPYGFTCSEKVFVGAAAD
jgi:hypothetical protein